MGSFGRETQFFEGHQCSGTSTMASRYREKEIEIRAYVKDVTHRKAHNALFVAPDASSYRLVYILMKVRSSMPYIPDRNFSLEWLIHHITKCC